MFSKMAARFTAQTLYIGNPARPDLDSFNPFPAIIITITITIRYIVAGVPAVLLTSMIFVVIGIVRSKVESTPELQTQNIKP